MNTTKKKININHSVDHLAFSCRLQNCLKAQGIKTLAELSKIPHHVLKQIPNLGKGTMDEIDRFFETHELVGEEMDYIDFAYYLLCKCKDKNENTEMASEIIIKQAQMIDELEKKLQLAKVLKG